MIQTIYHKCGHNREINMGLMSRNHRIDRAEEMGKGVCPDCERDEMKEFEKDHNLPELEGSHKQISWATKIRHIKLIGRYKERWDKTNVKSSYWIDNRNKFKPS